MKTIIERLQIGLAITRAIIYELHAFICLYQILWNLSIRCVNIFDIVIVLSGTGFTRPYQLSPQLSAVVGSDCLPRHEVVKRVWAIINERNLYDPKNKQFAICDSQLQTVIGVKRFRTFAMMKYLKTHFLEISQIG